MQQARPAEACLWTGDTGLPSGRGHEEAADPGHPGRHGNWGAERDMRFVKVCW